MRKRSTGFVALALSAGLLLGACSSGNPEDPQSALKENSVTAGQDTQKTTVTSGDGEEVEIAEELLSQEELRAIEEELAKTAPQETDPSEFENAVGGESDIHSKNLGEDFKSHYFDVDPASVEVPQEIKELYPDDDTARIVPSLLEALDWATYNVTATTGEVRDYEAESLTEYMSGYFSTTAEEEFKSSLKREKTELIAFSIMPFYTPTITFNGDEMELAPKGSWEHSINKIAIRKSITDDTGQNNGGVPVDLHRTVYVPLATGKYFAVDLSMVVVMAPAENANDNDWVIHAWSVVPNNSSEIVDLKEIL